METPCRKELKGVRMFTSENGDNVQIMYYMVESDFSIFGILVEKHIEVDKGIWKLIESDGIRGVTESSDEMAFIIDKLIGLCVTPTSLTYILDELVEKAYYCSVF